MSQTPPDQPMPPPGGPTSPPPSWGPPPPAGPPPGQEPGWGPPGQPAPPPGAPYPPSGQGWGPGQPAAGPAWQGGPPPGTVRKGRSPVIPVLIVVAVLAVGAIVALVLLSGDDDGSGPEAAARDFFEAGSRGDCEEAIELISTASLEDAGITAEQGLTSCQQAAEASSAGGLLGDSGAELVSSRVVSETDTTATVAMEVREDGETTTTNLDMINEDGAWKVDFGSLIGDSSTTPGSTVTEPGTATVPTDDGGSGSSDLDALEAGCAAGSMSDCDELYFGTPAGSAQEAFAMSCGGRDLTEEHYGDCEATFG